MSINVHSLHSGVKAECALSGKAFEAKGCDHVRMPKKHPVRPHLRAWRLVFEKTTLWLANEIGTSHSTVVRYETGQTGVDDATFLRIAKAYGITPAELEAPPADAGRARNMHRLLIRLRALDDKGVETLAELADRLSPRK